MSPVKPASAGAFHPIVDVLRALSVVAVVAYHAGMPGIPGGYVGVDVFFVISGFLIIGQIVAEHGRGRFSYAGFWARRALRILPTYLLVIVASSLIALYVLVMPGEFREFGRQVAWSAGMMVNHLFLNEQGYFDTAATSKPLLHLWSLAVEEQFYLFAPLVLGLLCWLARPRFGRIGRGIAAAIVAAMFVVSLWLCVLYTGTDDDAKNYAFYLMPLRAWEFILGGAVPFLLPLLRRRSQMTLMQLMAVGFGLILAAIFGFGHETPFPSWNAILPALGAALVIASGLASPDMPLVRILAVRPVLWIGLVSYAWYLWHWPLMAFSRIYNFGELPLAWGIAMGMVSLLLAALSYSLIEKPVKEWRKRTGMKLGLKPIMAGMAACAIVVTMGHAIAAKMPAKARADIPKSMLPGKARNAGACRLHVIKSSTTCLRKLHKQGRMRVGLLAGDSHARAAYNALDKLAARKDSSLVSQTQSGCIPLIGIHLVRATTGKVYPCHRGKERGMGYVIDGKIPVDYAILYSRWNNAAPWLDEEGHPGRQYRYIRDVGTGLSEPQDRIFRAALRRTLGRLRAGGVRRFLVIQATPEFDVDPSSCVIRSRKYGIPPDDRCSVSRRNVENRRVFSTRWLREAVQGQKDVRLIDPAPVFCDGIQCRGYDGDVVLYRDDDHVNDAGMRRIVERYRDDFDWVMGD